MFETEQYVHFITPFPQNCLRAGWGYLPWRVKIEEALTPSLSTLSRINSEMNTPVF